MSEPLRKCRVCGLEAWTTEELELFQKEKSCLYGRAQICRKCKSQEVMRKRALKPKKPKPRPPYLRKCKDCGLEAKTETDLELFRYSAVKPYQRDTWCKVCFNEWQRPRHYQRVRQEKIKLKLISSFPKPMLCYFCGEPVTLLNGKKAESIAIHSLDGNHNNWDPKNKTPTHRSCHSKWHSTGDRNPKRKNKKRGTIVISVSSKPSPTTGVK
jgi:5-methylcytosine-specific restriction endonuclease McrA